jgi:hypothetical protein
LFHIFGPDGSDPDLILQLFNLGANAFYFIGFGKKDEKDKGSYQDNDGAREDDNPMDHLQATYLFEKWAQVERHDPYFLLFLPLGAEGSL